MSEKTRKQNFNCGTTSERMKGNDYNFDLCESLHNSQREQLKLFSIGQAIKSARGMPWHQEPTKDVTSCDKLRGGANIH